MMQLTFVTVCMGRLAFLKQTLGHMVAQPDSRTILVDYSCPEQSGDWAEANFPAVRVVRIPGRTTISVTAARNAGSAVVDSPWICFVDSDIILNPAFAATVTPQVRPGNFYRPYPERGGISGTFLVARADFARAGGYDEELRSYGDDDYDLYDALRFAGVRQRRYPSVLVDHIDHGHDLRTGRFEFTEHRVGVVINRLYRVVKWELARARGAALSPDERAALYEECFGTVPLALTPNEGGAYSAEGLVDFAEGQLRGLGVAVGPEARERLRQAILHP
ncbi:MAG: galactosyltransferase-related protein [Gemmataceae bacterium]|nr:galactosyltransferase-related protein [Gemmataceae bacterium]